MIIEGLSYLKEILFFTLGYDSHDGEFSYPKVVVIYYNGVLLQYLNSLINHVIQFTPIDTILDINCDV